MKNKSIINLSLVATASLAATMSFIVIANNHKGVNLVRSDDNETIEVVMNKDNIYSNVSYDSEGRGTNQYAYFQMKYPGNYVVLDNYSNNAGSFGGDHLFECLCANEHYGYRLHINLYESRVRYFDSELKHKINYPEIKNVIKIEMWLGVENEIPLDPEELKKYNVEQDLEDENHYTITAKEKWGNWLTLLGTTMEGDYAQYVGKKLVMEQVSITYSCHNA